MVSDVKGKSATLVINVSSIAAGGETHTDLDTTLLFSKEIAITIRVTYDSGATDGVRVYVLASADKTNWDSENTTDAFTYFEPGFGAGETHQKTVNIDALPRYLRILVRNLDSSVATGEVKVWVHTILY